MKVIVNENEYNMELVANYMDDEIREELNRSWDDIGGEQEFVDAYCKAHEEKFGKKFEIN